MKKEDLFQIGHSETINLVNYDSIKDIYYFEKGWWMAGDTHRELEFYRFQKEYSPKSTNGWVVAPRRNDKTKEIELDKFILPVGVPTPPLQE